MDDPWVIGTLLSGGFLIAFGLLWLLVTTSLTRFSGWPSLAQEFPDQPRDPVVKKWSMASGTMGRSAITGVSYRNCLVVEACHSGLRFRVWRIMAPFAEPFFVPWSQISAETGVLGTVLLLFGNPEKGCMRVRSKLARKIEVASAARFKMPVK